MQSEHSHRDSRTMELVHDPLVLEAALALVDEWCVNAHKRVTPGTPTDVSLTSAETLSPHGLRKRAREELSWLRSSVLQLQRVVATKRTLEDTLGMEGSSNDDTEDSGDAEDSDEESGSESRAPVQRRVKARRLLEAVQRYNRAQAATSFSLRCAGSFVIRPVVDDQILATIRGQLDTLIRIAGANRVDVSAPPMRDTLNTFTDSGLRVQARVRYQWPFKMSLVAEASWDVSVEGMLQQRPTVRPHEIFATEMSIDETPWGLITLTTQHAWRRVYEDDGSILQVFTTTATASPKPCGGGGMSNPFAGFVIKQAGYNRMMRAPGHGVRSDRPLVLMDISQSMVAGAAPGLSISQDQFGRFWDAMHAPSDRKNSSITSLENRLMELQLASKT